MTHRPYSYVVLRYVPDPGAGEGLNVGVVLYSEGERHFAHRIDSRYERLSSAFAQFDGQAFRRTVANLKHAFRDAERSFAGAPLFSGDRSLSDWLKTILPDGGSLHFTSPRHGLSSDLAEEVNALYDRMVESQKARTDDLPRRDDAQVWRDYQKLLNPRVVNALQPKSFTTQLVTVEFEHAVKNGAWHVIQPLSMDFRQAEGIQRKASQWAGTAMGLVGVPDLGTVFFLLGEPHAHRQAYDRAKALLDRVPVKHEIVEERDADRLNQRLLDLLEHEADA
jgi:hypothetical protein